MTAVDEKPAETVEVSENTGPAPYASVDAIENPVTKAAFPVLLPLAEAFAKIATANASKTKGVDEIAADLFETSTDAKVVAIREKIAELTEQAKKSVLEQAKAIKAEGGEPDLEAEKNAWTAYKGVLDAVKTFPDFDRLTGLLPKVPSGNVRGAMGSSAASGPKNDLSAVRDWARKNGFEVKDRGRMSEEILDAYNKANAAK